LAEQFFSDRNPLGQQIQINMLNDPPREIVGVVGNVRQNRYEYDQHPQMYVPEEQVPARVDMTLSFDILNATFIVPSRVNPASAVSSFRKAAAGVDRTLAVTNVVTVEQYAAGQLRDLRNYATLLGIFGGISVFLSLPDCLGRSPT
jgi:putative ABC transport system permease protein